MNDGCKKYVPDGGRAVTSHRCGRKLAGDPTYPELCALHIAAIRRRGTREQERETARQRRAAEIAETDARVDAVNKALGLTGVAVTVYPEVGPERLIARPTGQVKIDLTELERLVEQVARLGKPTFL